MAPPTRARSLHKSAFSPAFARLKTSVYSDNLRPGSIVSASHFIRTLSWNAAGTFIATGAGDRTLRIWNPEKPNVKHSTELRAPGASAMTSLERVAFHPLNENELASCGTDGLVRFWDIRSKASVGEVRVGEQPFTLAWTPDGNELVAGRKDNLLVSIDRVAQRIVAEHPQSMQTNQCVFDWAGRHLFVTGGDGSIKILDYPSFDPTLTLNAHTASCFAIAMSPSGEYLAAGGGDALVSLWDTREWICVRTLDLTKEIVKSIDFSFDGSYIAAGSDDREEKKLHLAHVESGETVHTITVTTPSAQVAWHPCRYILAYSADHQGLKIVGGITGVKQSLRRRLVQRNLKGSLFDFKMDVRANITPADLFSAKGLVIVITGGGSGLGLAIASTLFQNGAKRIYLLGRREHVLQDAIKFLEAIPNAPNPASSVLRAISCDVTDTDSVRAAADQIKSDSSYVDVLFNNAGVIGPKNGKDIYSASTIQELSDALLSGWTDWPSTFAINTQSVIGVSAVFLPLLEAANAARGWASGRVTGTGVDRKQDPSQLARLGADPDDDRMAQIITVASVASFMRFVTAGVAYNTSKSAAAQLGKMMSTFLSEWGIRSNVICPGPYPSDMTAGNPTRYGTGQVPQGRMGRANDIGALALFLVGKGGAYVNGTVQVTDGGRLGVFPATY